MEIDSKTRLGDLLVRDGELSTDQLDQALEIQKAASQPIGRILERIFKVRKATIRLYLHKQKLIRKLFSRAEDAVTGVATRLGELLKLCGYLEEFQIEAALEEQKTSGKALGEILVGGGLLDQKELDQVLTFQSQIRKSTAAALVSLIFATSSMTNVAHADNSVATGSISITLRLLPSKPLVSVTPSKQNSESQRLVMYGATLHQDGRGDYYVTPFERPPDGMPALSEEIILKNNLLNQDVDGIVRIYVSPT